MKIAFFNTHHYEKNIFLEANGKCIHEIHFFDVGLTEKTTGLANGFPCVCVFVHDQLNESTLKNLKEGGTKLVALRSAGYNHVNLQAAQKLNLKVVRVPEYSPYAIAEHVVAMIQTLNRKTHEAYNRVCKGNFNLDGLVGFDLHGKTVGIIGVGKIGSVLTRIMHGFGCKVLLNDLYPNKELVCEFQCQYVSCDEIYKQADIISLNLPLTPETKYFINEKSLSLMKKGVMLINTGRGGLIDTKALIASLKSGHVGFAGLDVYENEEKYFFHDYSDKIINDEMLKELMSYPNVLITGHQAFLTKDALTNIADTTLKNVTEFEEDLPLTNEVIV